MKLTSNRQRNKLSRALWSRLAELAPPSVNIRSGAIGNYDVNRYSIRVEGGDNAELSALYRSFIKTLTDKGWRVVDAGRVISISHYKASAGEAYLSAPVPIDDHKGYFDISISMYDKEGF